MAAFWRARSGRESCPKLKVRCASIIFLVGDLWGFVSTAHATVNQWYCNGTHACLVLPIHAWYCNGTRGTAFGLRITGYGACRKLSSMCQLIDRIEFSRRTTRRVSE